MGVQKKYKDTVFRLVFKEKTALLELYNAVNGTNYSNAEDLEINTLENAIYMNFKNDISFVLDFQLSLYEHQSTVNPNLPLRDLFYVSRLLQNMIKYSDIYSSPLIMLPTPRFVVFYNGTDNQPERKVLRLSDSFQKHMDEPELELKVTVLNINQGNNKNLMECCQTLKEYMQYVDKVRDCVSRLGLEDGVELAVTECIKEGILAEFLLKNRAEAVAMSIFEYDEELHFKALKAEGYAAGILIGKKEERILLLTSLVQKGLISIKDAAQEADMSEKEFTEQMRMPEVK